MAKGFSNGCRRLAAPLINWFAARFAAMGITPNMITIAGIVPYLIVAWLLWNGNNIAAAVMLIIFAPLDVVDGTLARNTGQETPFGAFLDSTVDRIEEIIMYGALIAYFQRFHEESLLLGLIAFAALTGSLMVSYTRARAEAMGFKCDGGLLTRFERFLLFIFALLFKLYLPVLTAIAILSYFTTVQRILLVRKQAREK